jgi:hypothetical protein
MLVMALLHGGLEEASDTPNRCANVEEALRYRAWRTRIKTVRSLQLMRSRPQRTDWAGRVGGPASEETLGFRLKGFLNTR